MTDYTDTALYDSFGVSAYHTAGNVGAHTKIAIIDTGLLRPDLPDWQNVHVINISDAGSSQSHGGEVTSLIAAGPNNFGIIGIAYGADVYVMDVDDTSNMIWETKVSDAIQYAVDIDVDAISISLGSSVPSSYLTAKIQEALARNIQVFAAIGNSETGAEGFQYPASIDGVIAVASCDRDRNVSSFNLRNNMVALFAPGEDVPVSSVDGGVAYVSGTSFSTPFAAGLYLLALSAARIERGDDRFRYTREETVALLQNSQHLNTASLSFGTLTLTGPTDGENGNDNLTPNADGDGDGGGGSIGPSSTILMVLAVILLIAAAVVVYIVATRKSKEQVKTAMRNLSQKKSTAATTAAKENNENNDGNGVTYAKLSQRSQI
jgi:hypothetical protein